MNVSDDVSSLHPWKRFLNARRDVIIWLSEEMKQNDLEIAQCMSMDETQVYLIRIYPELNKLKKSLSVVE